jgi:hypothetical protein
MTGPWSRTWITYLIRFDSGADGVCGRCGGPYPPSHRICIAILGQDVEIGPNTEFLYACPACVRESGPSGPAVVRLRGALELVYAGLSVAPLSGRVKVAALVAEAVTTIGERTDLEGSVLATIEAL